MGTAFHFGYVEEHLYVFRETFTGNGAATTFQLTSNVGNATFETGSWTVVNVETAMAADASKTTGAALYDSLLPLVRHKITVVSISATGLVTLDYAPLAENFYIWYWYDMEGDAIQDYYRDDYVSSMEADSGVTIASGITVDVTAFGGILSAADNTVQKALDTIDNLSLTPGGLTFAATAKVLGRGSSGGGAGEELALSSDYGLTFTFTTNSLKINTSQDLQAAAIPIFGGLTLKYGSVIGASVAVSGAVCSLGLGVDDSVNGVVSIYGSSTLIGKGGELRLYVDNASHGVFHYFSIYASTDDLTIGLSTDSDALKLESNKDFSLTDTEYFRIQSGGATRLQFRATPTTGALTLGADDLALGSLLICGNATGSVSGGQIYIYTAADHDTTIDYYRIQANEDDLLLGPATDLDALKLDAAGDFFVTAGTISCSDLTDGYIPYHVSDAAGLANSFLYHTVTNLQLIGVPDIAVDISTFTEADPSGDVTLTASSASVSTIRRDENAYVYKDYGAAYFGSAVTVYFEVNFTGVSTTGYAGCACVTLSTNYGTFQDLLTAADGIAVYLFRTAGGLWQFLLYDCSDGGSTSYTDVATTPLRRYLTLTRSGTTAELDIYSDSGRTALLGNCTVTIPATAWRYMQVVASRENATSGTETISFDTDNVAFNLGAAGATFIVDFPTGAVTTGVWRGTSVAADYGGTGQTSYAVGDILYASGATTLSKLADVAAGAYLRSGGVTTAPLWSTLILPNAATAFRLVVATSANTIGELVAGGATGEYLAGATGAIPAWATLNQAAVSGLTTGSSPVFVTVKLSGLTDGYVPYHVSDAVGLANSVIQADATYVGIACATTIARLEVEDAATTASILVKITQDDANTYGLVIGNDTYSTTDTNGLRFVVSDVGAPTISWTAGDLTLSGNAIYSAGGRRVKVTTVTDTYTALATDDVIVCNKSTAFTVTLPTASGGGRRYHIKNINTGSVTVTGFLTERDDETGATWGNTGHGLSLAAGQAFFNATGFDMSAFAGTEGTSSPYLLTLHDSAGKIATGYIGAVDAAETLSGSELVGNPGFETAGAGGVDVFGTWTETAVWGTSVILRDTAVFNGGAASCKLTRGDTQVRVLQSFAVTAGKLYKLTFATRGDGTYAGQYRVYDNDGAASIIAIVTTGVTAASWTTVTRYFTAPSGCTSAQIGFYAPVTPTGFAHFDDASIQEVTHVGATGAHIISTITGSTRDWTSIESGFNYNDTSYTFEINTLDKIDADTTQILTQWDAIMIVDYAAYKWVIL